MNEGKIKRGELRQPRSEKQHGGLYSLSCPYSKDKRSSSTLLAFSFSTQNIHHQFRSNKITNPVIRALSLHMEFLGRPNFCFSLQRSTKTEPVLIIGGCVAILIGAISCRKRLRTTNCFDSGVLCFFQPPINKDYFFRD